MPGMRRREFVSLFGGAAAWPLAAHAQQQAMPAIGVLNSTSPVARAHLVTAFRQGVLETGYVQDQNVAMEYRWAQDQYDRLPDLLADLIRRKVAVIAATDPLRRLRPKPQTRTYRSSSQPGVTRSRTASSRVSIDRVVTSPVSASW
jgi:putative ABC transport system substrate-binding protein